MAEIPFPNFFRAMDEWRCELELSDRQFALQVLGISDSQWWRLRHGERPLMSDFLQECFAKRRQVKGAYIADLVAA